ncbi:RNA-directed DNA polymerase, eukaryota [Tanacetum coccineum]
MFSIQIHHGGKFQRYPGRVYVSAHVDMFDMVDIDLFTVVALNMMVVKLGYTSDSESLFYNYLRPPTSLDEGLYALDYEEDVRCMATLVRSIKLIAVYIEHGVTALDSYIRPPRFRATIEDITDEPELDGEACFTNVTGSGVESSMLSHDESFGVDDLDLNLNEPVNLNVSQIETQSELLVSKESDAGKTQEHIVAEEDESAPSDGQLFYDDEGIYSAYETEYDVQSSEDAVSQVNMQCRMMLLEGENVDVINADGFDSDPGNDADQKLQHKSKIFTMSQGTGPTGPNYGMEAGPSGSSGPVLGVKKRKNTGTNNDSQTYDKGDLCPLVLKIKHCTYKFLSEKIFDQVRVNLEIPVKAVQDQLQRDLELQISMSKAFRSKAKAEREIRGDPILQYSILRDYVVELQYTNPNITVKIAVEKNTDPSLPTKDFQRIYVCLGALKCLGDDIDLHLNSNFTFISDRQKGIIPTIKTVFPSAEHRYCLQHIHENIKQGWCGQAYNDLLWRFASTASVKEFEKCRAKSDLLLNNIRKVFNGKIVRGVGAIIGLSGDDDQGGAGGPSGAGGAGGPSGAGGAGVGVGDQVVLREGLEVRDIHSRDITSKVMTYLSIYKLVRSAPDGCFVADGRPESRSFQAKRIPASKNLFGGDLHLDVPDVQHGQILALFVSDANHIDYRAMDFHRISLGLHPFKRREEIIL